MATTTLSKTEVESIEKKPATKYVFFFGNGKADGNGKMKDELDRKSVV